MTAVLAVGILNIVKLNALLPRVAVAAAAVGSAWALWALLGGPTLNRLATALVVLCTFSAIVMLALRAAALGRQPTGVRDNLVLVALMAVAVGPLPRLLGLWMDTPIGKPEQFLGVLLGIALAGIPIGFEYLQLRDPAD